MGGKWSRVGDGGVESACGTMVYSRIESARIYAKNCH